MSNTRDSRVSSGPAPAEFTAEIRHVLTALGVIPGMGGSQPETALHTAALQVASFLVDKAAKEQAAKK